MAWGGDISSGGPTGTWWFQMNMRHSNSSNDWGTQLAYGWEDNANQIYQRNVTGGNWSAWVRYLNSGNYNSYAPTLTGGGASGTWGISITGNAGTVTDGVYLSGTQSITGMKYFVSNGNTTGNSYSLQAYSNNGSGAVMSFHRGGYYAVNMGLDSDDVFRIGGWSASPNRLQLDMSGNLTVAGHVRAGTNVYTDGNYGYGLVGLYNSTIFQGVFAMGDAYKLTPGGGINNLYGLAWSHPNAGGQAANLSNHGLLVVSNGVTQCALTNNIWVLGQFNGSGAGLTGTASSLSIGGSAGSVAWGNVTGKPSNIMYYQGFTLDANTMDSNATGFTYSVNAPFTGPIARFSAGGSYDMWLGGNYGGSGNAFYIRTRNGDTASINPWRQLITDGNIGSQSVLYATTAGSAPNGSNINNYYDTTAGNGYGFRFWNGSDAYKISMGASALYYYGPVTDYSIKMQMNDGDTGRGFTWGRISYAPIAALNSTSGNMQIAGTFTANTLYAEDSVRFNQGVSVDNTFGIYFDSARSAAYAIYRTGGAWTHPYPDLRIAMHTGIQMGANAGYGGMRFYSDYDMSTMVASINDGDTNMRGYYDIIAYASDKRLKHNIQPIENALSKVKLLTGMTYQWNELGRQHGWEPDMEIREAGVFAQDVQAVLPEAVRLAPFDNDKGVSKSGENFLTVKYEKIVPLLIEAIKEQQKQIEELKTKLK
jgi:hypothetical protein